MSNLLSIALPETLTFSVVLDSGSNADSSYFDLTVKDDPNEDHILEGLTFNSHCLDTDRPLTLNFEYTAQVYSSYDLQALEDAGLIHSAASETGKVDFIEKPENLDLVNWIINQGFAGKTASNGEIFTSGDVQRAIWSLIDDRNAVGGLGDWTQEKADEIEALATAQGEGFVPSYDYTTIFGEQVTGKLAVILIPEGLNNQFVIAEVELAKLGDFVFEDVDADGIQDAGEAGIGGVTVNLLADINGDGNIDSSEVIDTTTTDSNGAYDFEVAPGEYRVEFEQPDSFQVSPSDQGGDDTVDSDGLLSDVVSLAPGENNPTIDSGFYRPAELGDFVFEDSNGNGIQDSGENGVAGVTVKLQNPDGTPVLDSNNNPITTITAADGSYSFTGLVPGEYKVMFVAPNGFEFTQSDVGGDDTVDSDADPTNGMTQTVILESGEINNTLDAGLIRRAQLGDFVFEDTNGNGIQDNGEVGVDGVTVNLTGAGADGDFGTADDISDVQVTSNGGNYLFTDLAPGDYKVTFSDLPAGFVFTEQDAGGDDAVDSDADPSNGMSQVVTLNSGDSNLTVDAGIFLPNPEVKIEKLTNGEDADLPEDAVEINVGDTVTWTYEVTNTGSVSIAQNDVVITDDNGTSGDTSDDFSSTDGSIVLTDNGDGDGFLSPGEIWKYTASDVAQDLSQVGDDIIIRLKGNSHLDGTNGNIRTFSADGVSVNTSAFSRNKYGNWEESFLGAFSSGLGVTNSGEGNGGNGLHRVDNVGQKDFVLFEFSETVIVDKTFLDSVRHDSDITAWLGSVNDPFNNHNLIDDDFLSDLEFNEDNNTFSSSSRWANINNGEVAGNVLVIAASTSDPTPEDRFKISKLKLQTLESGIYQNIGTVEVPGATDSDPSSYVNPTPNPGIDIEKFVNGIDVTNINHLPTIAVGDDLTFTYEVSNTGNVPFAFADVTVTDDNGTAGNSHDDFTPNFDAASDVGSDGILSPGETWVYASDVQTAQDLSTPIYEDVTFHLTGHSSTTGRPGNTRTFTANNVTVDVSAFSKNKANGIWKDAYLGAYGGGLGVTNILEGGSAHRVDNHGSVDYIVLEFDREVIADRAFLDYVGHDSDISFWIGDRVGDIDNLNDQLLASFTEGKNFTHSSNSRWADINNQELSGDTLIISAYTGGSNDSFKLKKLELDALVGNDPGSYVNIATVSAGSVMDSDASGYIN